MGLFRGTVKEARGTRLHTSLHLIYVPPYSSHDLTTPSNCDSHPNPTRICEGSTLFTTQQKTLPKTAYHIKYTKMAYTNTPWPSVFVMALIIYVIGTKERAILCVYRDMTSSHMLTAIKDREEKLTHFMNVGFLII